MDAHTVLVEAGAQLNGLRNLTVGNSDDPLTNLTGFELDMLLKPIGERIEQAISLIDEYAMSAGHIKRP